MRDASQGDTRRRRCCAVMANACMCATLTCYTGFGGHGKDPIHAARSTERIGLARSLIESGVAHPGKRYARCEHSGQQPPMIEAETAAICRRDYSLDDSQRLGGAGARNPEAPAEEHIE